MKTLTLAKPWTYRTPTMTVDYLPGSHDVTDAIHAQAVAEGAVKDETNGDGAAKTGSQGARVTLEG